MGQRRGKDRRGLALVLLVAMSGMARGGELPKGFVYLADVDPTIVQDMRYFGSHNFVGRRVAGYDAAECILTEVAALALAKAQASLAPQGFGFKVYDCYRPAKAVRDFVAWSKDAKSDAGRAYFYSTLPKRRLFALGYIASRSNHSAGSTVDIGLVKRNQDSSASQAVSPDAPPEPDDVNGETCFEQSHATHDVDMGTDFDCFHPRSAFGADGISAEARANRDLLRRAMTEAGFRAYDTEWWHFTLRDEPYPKRAFDFPVTARTENVGNASDKPAR